MNRGSFPLFLTFFAASWLSNDWIIRTTGKLVQTSTLEMVLAVSSLSGIVFFILLKSLAHVHRPVFAAATMVPLWITLYVVHDMFPQYPVASTLIAILLGETMKWHAYSQVLHRYGPISAGQIIGYGVLAYEIGTLAASVTATVDNTAFVLTLNVIALGCVHLPFFIMPNYEERGPTVFPVSKGQTSVNLLPWIMVLGAFAGFLKVSADTGFKYALRQSTADPTDMVARFYLLSSVITMGLWLLKRQRWMSTKLERPEVALSGLAIVQCLFGTGLLSGGLPILIWLAALQRSFDKVFYQPTIQLLASGFSSSTQEVLRRFHNSSFLGIGSLMGLVAFAVYGTVKEQYSLISGITTLHLLISIAFACISTVFLKKMITALDEESKDSKTHSGTRAMAMLALLSPKHFLVRALIWSNKRGGLHTLPQEILQGLSNTHDTKTISAFYVVFPQLDETHQIAIVKLAIFLDGKNDRDFLLSVANESIVGVRKARQVAALHVVKVHGKVYRPLLRKARSRKAAVRKVS